MPDRQNSSLTFPLEESLWFEKGQEVDVLISISLDPRISIEDDDDYITLSGSLELYGEYKHISQNEQNDTFDAFPVQGRKYIQTVETRNEAESAFVHHFPVEITIPKSRVPNINEVELGIQSFDYELPEKGRLQVIADIFVVGLYEESEVIENDDEEESFQQEQEEKRAEVDSEAQEVLVGNHEAENDEEVEVELVNLTEEFQQLDVDDDDDYDIRPEEESTNAESQLSDSDDILYEPFKAVARMIPKDIKDIDEQNTGDLDLQSPFPNLPEFSFDPFIQNILEQNQTAHRNVDPHYYYESKPHMESSDYSESSSSPGESSSDDESTSEVKVAKKKKKKDKYEAMSFADFFARKEDDESISKIKMRLVQQGDSIQALAEKYKVTPQQILRANHMEASNEVYEGQVLYIPVKQSNNKTK